MANRENYNKIFENGLNHINAAKLLANSSLFGFAISHLILGIEELIKYQVMLSYFADTKLFDEDINLKNRKSIFRDHIKKHDLIKEFQQSISKEFSSDYFDYLFHKWTGQELTQKHLEIEKNRFKEIGSFISVSYTDINIPEEERDAFFKWLGNANNFKNNGFYVNWTGELTFETPSDIKKEDYDLALKFTEAFLKQTEEVIKDLDMTDDELMAYLNTEL